MGGRGRTHSEIGTHGEVNWGERPVLIKTKVRQAQMTNLILDDRETVGSRSMAWKEPIKGTRRNLTDGQNPSFNLNSEPIERVCRAIKTRVGRVGDCSVSE